MSRFGKFLKRLRRKIFGGKNHNASQPPIIIPPPGPPGQFELSSDEYSVLETAGFMQITVNRTNGIEGAMSVQYNTVNGTAIAGVDYTTTSGTLNWSSGDGQPRSFYIPIIQRPTVSGDFTFTVLLLSPSAPSTLGTPATAPVTILRRSFGEAAFAGDNWYVKNPDPNPATSVTVFVQRNISFKGLVTVDWQTQPGTATPGVDYTTGSGTLTWVDTDGSAKAIVVAIPPRPGGPFPDRDFTILLDNPTGGIVISGTNPTTVTVTDGVPPANPTVTASLPNQIVDDIGYFEESQLIDDQCYNSANILVYSGYGATAFRTSISDIWFISPLVGWSVGFGGVIFHTTDGGVTWVAQSSGVTSNLNGVFFADANNGWAIGDGGVILHTSNGGSVWAAQTSGTTENLYGLWFIDANTGWVVGANGTILHTTNGGTLWSPQVSGTVAQLNAIYAADANNAWAVGAAGVILHTTDGGANWVNQVSGTVENLNGVYFVGANGWAVGDNGTILHTTNSGGTWTPQTSTVTVNLNDVVFVDANNGWVVGDDGVILYTTNGGALWTQQTSGTTEDLLAVAVGDATTIFTSGDSGTVLGTTDGGNTWDSQNIGGIIGFGGLGDGGGTSNYGGGGDFFNTDDTYKPTNRFRFQGYANG